MLPRLVYDFDEFILDRIFQPIGDRLHQWWGVTPQDICEFFAVGAILAKIVYLYFTFPVVMEAEQGLMLVTNVLVMAVLTMWIVFPRDAGTSTTLNMKRLKLIVFRLFWFYFIFFDLSKLAVIWQLHETTVKWGEIADCSCTFLTWCGFCFASLNRPPPRRARDRKWLAWLRPRFAT
jgi:hypothetical protein